MCILDWRNNYTETGTFSLKQGNAWSVGRRFYKQICQYWKQFLISIVESKLYFFKIQMKILFWYSTITIQPGFGITPKSFHSIDVSIISDIFIHSMKNDFVFSSHAKWCICCIIISVVKLTFSGVLFN